MPNTAVNACAASTEEGPARCDFILPADVDIQEAAAMPRAGPNLFVHLSELNGEELATKCLEMGAKAALKGFEEDIPLSAIYIYTHINIYIYNVHMHQFCSLAYGWYHYITHEHTMRTLKGYIPSAIQAIQNTHDHDHPLCVWNGTRAMSTQTRTTRVWPLPCMVRPIP